jgi:hypothetical protein
MSQPVTGPGSEDPNDLPDAPSTVAVQQAHQPEPSSNTEILTVDPYRPLTRHEKWQHFVGRTHASATFLSAGEDVVFTRMTGGIHYCCGAAGWGKNYGSSLADIESRTFFGSYLFPALLKQDPRFFPKRHGNLFGRGWYATTRVVVTRNDSGAVAPNYSEILGVAFSQALANAYYPDRERGGWETWNRILGTVQSDATGNLLREFWPDIRRVVRRYTPKSILAMEKRLPLPSDSSQY